jgi:hypothetical protein
MKKWLLPLLLLCLTNASPADPPQDALHQQIRSIRRAYLDVLELLPTPEEIDWYVVYNQNGYPLAADFLSRKAPDQWPKERLLSPQYLESAEQPIERAILDKNVVYLSGLWTGEMSETLKEAGIEKFIKNALLATDEKVSDAIDYMINLLTCRPSSAAEENEFAEIFNKVSLKEDEMAAWRTVLLHLLEMHDCKYK